MNTLRSAVYSARIEGNSLLPEEVDENNSKDEQKEVKNVIMAYQYINRTINSSQQVTPQLIQQV
ncbi:MAG: hypothetical protein AAB893_04785, partial [Patescibacteria group bacterium]